MLNRYGGEGETPSLEARHCEKDLFEVAPALGKYLFCYFLSASSELSVVNSITDITTETAEISETKSQRGFQTTTG